MGIRDRIRSTLVGMILAFTWQNITRTGGFSGLMFLVVAREKPEPLLIIACCAMMGLPTFWDIDRSSRR